MSLPSKKYGPRKRSSARTYWKGDMVPPKGQEPSDVTVVATVERTGPECQYCHVAVKHPYTTCFPCYNKLDDTAKSRIRQQWRNKGKWLNR